MARAGKSTIHTSRYSSEPALTAPRSLPSVRTEFVRRSFRGADHAAHCATATVTELLHGSLDKRVWNTDIPLTLYERMRFGHETALGMAWRHSMKPRACLHFDLKLSNVLVRMRACASPASLPVC